MEPSVKSKVLKELDMEAAKKMHLLQDHRLQSFTTSWPFKSTESCNIQSVSSVKACSRNQSNYSFQMAEAGFYFCGNDRENDTAACFVCGKILDGWESTDVPIEEHRKHAPQCLFVKMRKLEKEFSVSGFFYQLESGSCLNTEAGTNCMFS